MDTPTKTISIISEGLSTDTDAISLHISLLPPSIPSHEDLKKDYDKMLTKKVMDNVKKQSELFYKFNEYELKKVA